MRQFIQIINEAQLQPNIVEDDGDVPHALYASFDDEGEAYIRYWATRDGYIALHTMHSSPAVRGRDMLKWLNAKYDRPIAVVEAIPEALGFWDRMQKEGLVYSVDGADGWPSELEKRSIPINQASSDDHGYDDADDRPDGGWYFDIDNVIYDHGLDRAVAIKVAASYPHAYRVGSSYSIDYKYADDFADAVEAQL